MQWYYQIKGKNNNPNSGLFGSNWTFPPIFVGKVTADTRKSAIDSVNSLYGKKFPTRVLQKDLDSNEFLLSIQEIKDTDRQILELFDIKTCKQCNQTFRVVDHYNNHNAFYKGRDFCSQEYRNEHEEVARYIKAANADFDGIHPPVIYRVTNRITSQVYIGKTTQAFTLRWYQHFFQGGDTKFHQAIKQSNICDWIFEVLEKIAIPVDIKNKADIEKLIFDREKYWINHHDSVANGYNSI